MNTKTIEKAIRRYVEREKENAKKALNTEKNIVCINPDSYIAREIKYQTALLHEILEEIKYRG